MAIIEHDVLIEAQPPRDIEVGPLVSDDAGDLDIGIDMTGGRARPRDGIAAAGDRRDFDGGY